MSDTEFGFISVTTFTWCHPDNHTVVLHQPWNTEFTTSKDTHEAVGVDLRCMCIRSLELIEDATTVRECLYHGTLCVP